MDLDRILYRSAIRHRIKIRIGLSVGIGPENNAIVRYGSGYSHLMVASVICAQLRPRDICQGIGARAGYRYPDPVDKGRRNIIPVILYPKFQYGKFPGAVAAGGDIFILGIVGRSDIKTRLRRYGRQNLSGRA